MITAPSISIAFSCWRTGDVLLALSLTIVQPIIVAIIINLRAGFTLLTVVAENYKVNNKPSHENGVTVFCWRDVKTQELTVDRSVSRAVSQYCSCHVHQSAGPRLFLFRPGSAVPSSSAWWRGWCTPASRWGGHRTGLAEVCCGSSHPHHQASLYNENHEALHIFLTWSLPPPSP